MQVIQDLELVKIISSGLPIEPIAQAETKDVEAISPILYTQEYKEAMGYLRAVMASREYSDRSLRLTAYIIAKSPAHYTVWTFRYDCLKALKSDLTHELKYIQMMAEESSKNYQIWHHRELIIRLHGLANTLPEKEFLNAMLAEDAKNYHVWCYRQWLCKHFPDFRVGEKDFTRTLIKQDIFNNSAWNHRYFILFELDERLNPEQVDDEVKYVKSCIDRNPDNVSPWNYLVGLYKKVKGDISELTEYIKYFDDSVPALEILASIYEKRSNQECAKMATCIYEKLKKLDSIRLKYWDFRVSMVGT